jgi:hypothetical protein
MQSADASHLFIIVKTYWGSCGEYAGYLKDYQNKQKKSGIQTVLNVRTIQQWIFPH